MAIHTTVFKNARTVTCVIAKNKWGCVEKNPIVNKFGNPEEIPLGTHF